MKMVQPLKLLICVFTCVNVIVSGRSYDTNYLQFGRKVLSSHAKPSATYQCKDTLTCIQMEMLKNVTDMSASDDVNLTASLLLEKIPGAVHHDGVTLQEVERRLSKGADKKPEYLSTVLANKTLGLMHTHSLKWTLFPGVDIRLYRTEGDQLDAALEVQEVDPDGRTFGLGARKRIMMALLPMMYKMGVMTTMLGGLIVLTLKGLTIGVILLVLAVSNLLIKFNHGHGGWYPPPSGHGPPIHVHVHTDSHKQAYNGWHSASASSYPVEYHSDR